MRTLFDVAQDLTLWITKEESEMLLKGPTENFHDMHETSTIPKKEKHYILLKGTCREVDAYIFLGYCKNEREIFTPQDDIIIYDMDQMGKMRISLLRGDPWYINLSDKGIDHFRRGWEFGVRYDGEHKLFIFEETK